MAPRLSPHPAPSSPLSMAPSRLLSIASPPWPTLNLSCKPPSLLPFSIQPTSPSRHSPSVPTSLSLDPPSLFWSLPDPPIPLPDPPSSTPITNCFALATQVTCCNSWVHWMLVLALPWRPLCRPVAPSPIIVGSAPRVRRIVGFPDR
jgi:hypothetical protein